MSRVAHPRSVSLQFSSRELLDLLVAWLALGIAFMVFFAGGAGGALGLLSSGPSTLIIALVVSLVTAGIGFLFHELGHKVSAVRFNNVAVFRADYGMLFVAVMSAFLGFLFAAPGAVHHRGPLTDRQHGLVALAGPAVNLVLAALFVPALVLGSVLNLELVALVGSRGLAVNLFLAAFNLVPLGPLDGSTVLDWSKLIWFALFLPTAAVTVVVVFVFRIGF
ncbi:metalloprotease [Halolamina sp.]|uniref:metalloprotease n=1 Tax=Halolamina sp. TaxID=1940283 RepID=UPI0031F308A3